MQELLAMAIPVLQWGYAGSTAWPGRQTKYQDNKLQTSKKLLEAQETYQTPKSAIN